MQQNALIWTDQLLIVTQYMKHLEKFENIKNRFSQSQITCLSGILFVSSPTAMHYNALQLKAYSKGRNTIQSQLIDALPQILLQHLKALQS